jgi:hypothetical protein
LGIGNLPFLVNILKQRLWQEMQKVAKYPSHCAADLLKHQYDVYCKLSLMAHQSAKSFNKKLVSTKGLQIGHTAKTKAPLCIHFDQPSKEFVTFSDCAWKV